VTTRLFRSRDRAATWEAMPEFPQRFAGALFALAPRFGSDGLALVAQNRAGASPASSQCVLLRSADGGAQWTEVLTGPRYGSCHQLWMAGEGAGLVAFVFPDSITHGPFGWRFSRDAGQTWSTIPLPDGARAAVDPQLAVVPSPAFGRDRTVFVGAPSGLWLWQLGCPSAGAGGAPRTC
jgi:hypothetical protein